MIVDDSSRASAITSCGIIKTNYAYNGTYGFILQFGGASLYVYDSTRGKKHYYKIFSRSWYPSGIGFKVLDIDFNKGFLLYKTNFFNDVVDKFMGFSFALLHDMKGHEFSPYEVNFTAGELFKSEIL